MLRKGASGTPLPPTMLFVPESEAIEGKSVRGESLGTLAGSRLSRRYPAKKGWAVVFVILRCHPCASTNVVMVLIAVLYRHALSTRGMNIRSSVCPHRSECVKEGRNQIRVHIYSGQHS